MIIWTRNIGHMNKVTVTYETLNILTASCLNNTHHGHLNEEYLRYINFFQYKYTLVEFIKVIIEYQLNFLFQVVKSSF